MKKILILLFLILIVVTLTFGGRMFWLARKSPSMVQGNLGVKNGHLSACGKKPNCVSSTADQDSDFYLAPLVSDNVEVLWDDLNLLLPEMGFTLQSSVKNYLHFTASTKLFGFIDDMEFHLIPSEGLIEMRSQSRVGYSDMGTNRKRIEKIRKKLQPQPANN